jgi:Amidase
MVCCWGADEVRIRDRSPTRCGGTKTRIERCQFHSQCSFEFKVLIMAVPCSGPSSGSAFGVSAGFTPLSLGTETRGSLVYPASKAGLYAMRPAHGSVSAKGVFRISRSFDVIGLMARTPYDVNLLAESILTPK